MEDNKRKKAPNLVLAIVCVTLIIFFAVLFTVCVISYNKPGEKASDPSKKSIVSNELAKNKPEEVVENEDDTNIVEEDKEYVRDADYKPTEELKEEYDLYGKTYRLSDIKAPFITINSEYVKGVNAEIKTIYDEAVGIYKEGTTDGMSYVDTFEYKYFVNGDILSLVLETAYGETDDPAHIFYVYNIDTKNGNKVEEKNIAEYLKEDDLKAKIMDAVMDKFNEETAHLSSNLTEQKESTKKHIEDGDYKVFLGEGKMLSAVARIDIPAGRGYKYMVVEVVE
jgi:hypothetical protein